MKKLKVIQIGVGHDHAPAAFDSLLKQSEIFEVVAFAVPESEMKDFTKNIKKYRDEKKIPLMSIKDALNIPNLDAAVIETEELNLTKYAIMAAEKGLHIHMDKPGGTELADFERLIKIVKEKSLAFSTGYMYRFNPKILEVHEKIKKGDLGEIYSVEAHMDCKHVTEKRQWLERFPGGMMFYLGCHLVDLIYKIQGEPLEVIPMNCPTGFDGVTAEDYGMVAFKYPNGISFAKTCANEYGGFLRRQLVICGTKGTVEIKPLEVCVAGGQYTVMNENYNTSWHTPGEVTQTEVYDRYNDMMKSFAELVCGEKENPYSYDYELNLYKLLLKSCGKEI